MKTGRKPYSGSMLSWAWATSLAAFTAASCECEFNSHCEGQVMLTSHAAKGRCGRLVQVVKQACVSISAEGLPGQLVSLIGVGHVCVAWAAGLACRATVLGHRLACYVLR